MKNLNQYIKEKLVINKDYSDGKIVVKSVDELRKIIEDRYKKLGPGTKQDPIDFNDIDVSNLDSFCNNKYQGMFNRGLFEDTYFKYIDISDWDASNVKSMHSMFYGCKKLKSVGDISKWDVSNVEDMACMFCHCEYLNQNISNWDVSNVTNMTFMFQGCNNFNQDISDWDVSNVTNMSYMFCWCKSFNQDISDWDVLNVRNKDNTFKHCAIKDEYKPKFK